MFKLVNQKEIKTVIEKSKFFSFSYNCYSTEQLNKILKEVRKKNQSATHVCYACIIHEDNDVLCYSSDDREPSGTAGLQILQALKENNMIKTSNGIAKTNINQIFGELIKLKYIDNAVVQQSTETKNTLYILLK